MAAFERRFSKDNLPMYYKEGKRVKRNQVPEGYLKAWELEDKTVDEPTTTADTISGVIPLDCLFCGAEGTHTRFLDFKTVHLCEDDYNSQTLGKIAYKIREH